MILQYFTDTGYGKTSTSLWIFSPKRKLCIIKSYSMSILQSVLVLNEVKSSK